MSSKLFGIIKRSTLDVPDYAENRIANDVYLNSLYTEELALIRGSATVTQLKDIVELGSAGGNTKQVWPEVVTTDVRKAQGVDLEMSAEKLDFPNKSIDLIFGLDALHHFRSPAKHFAEVDRVLRNNGNAVYIEPNWNMFSMLCFKFLLKYLHPEPYNTKVGHWDLTDPDPMMGNQAQAHNIFIRDAAEFKKQFPNLTIEIGEPIKGLSFLLSGGVHTRLPISGKLLWKFHCWEQRHPKWKNAFALGRVIVLTKKP